MLINNFVALALESAPWLVLGLILGGLIKTMLPTEFLNKHLKADSLGSISKATLLGAPLPLCSCGVVPAAVGLRQAGASKSATVSFLISTPETGVDSISVTYALMGPIMAIARTVSALFSAFITGVLVFVFNREADTKTEPTKLATSCCGSNSETVVDSCCGSANDKAVDSCCSSTNDKAGDSCCGSTNDKPVDSCCSGSNQPMTSSWLGKAKQGIEFAFMDMLGDIVGWLTLGLLFAAVVQTYVPTDFLTQWGSGFIAMLVMLLIGIPMYVCATASTPIAVGLILAGISPGVALVFLLSGPATNIGTLGIISKLLGRKTMWIYLLGTASSALLAGWLFDKLILQFDWQLLANMQAHHEMLPKWLQILCVLILVLSAINIYRKKWFKRS
ncbi:SO_0444 family Cu/Zn efflux transporter [Thiomicrorhabdus hydrogeniphila]